MAKLIRPGQVVSGTYLIEKPLAFGGYAFVYAATRVDDGSQVVVKALRADATKLDRSAVERFHLEASVAAELDHPNILKTLDFGETQDGIAYMVLPRLFGLPLKKLMFKEPIDPSVVRNVMMQMLRGLREAHRRNIVHRDLKPENTFVCREQERDREGEKTGYNLIKLLDLGFVKILGTRGDGPYSGLTLAGQAVGTPGYMAPEMLKSGEVSTLVDLYSCGVLGFELLTARQAFPGEGIQRIIAQAGQEPEPPPPEVGELPIFEVVKGLMASDPAQRYQDAATALADLRMISCEEHPGALLELATTSSDPGSYWE